MSLSPGFVLWAGIAAAQLVLTGGVIWLVRPDPLRALLRHVHLGDAVALWLGYAALYHLVFLAPFRAVLGPPIALWLLCGALAVYGLSARLRSARAADWRFAWIVLAWAGTLAAGQGFIDQTEADAALLKERPAAVVNASSEHLRPLWRVALLARVPDEDRQATAEVLAGLLAAVPPDPGTLAAFRVGRVPYLLEAYDRELSRLHTYHWLQVGMLLLVLAAWGFGPRLEQGGPPAN